MVFRRSPPVSGLWGLLIFLAVLNCSAGDRGRVKRFETRELSIQRNGAPGEPIRVRVEIARTEGEREQGLMNRRELPDGEGMLFVFEQDQILRFWMKNTLVPLSIAFISAGGSILEIFPMEPQSLNPVSSSRSARYALEVPRDWFSRAGIAPGDRIVLNF